MSNWSADSGITRRFLNMKTKNYVEIHVNFGQLMMAWCMLIRSCKWVVLLGFACNLFDGSEAIRSHVGFLLRCCFAVASLVNQRENKNGTMNHLYNAKLREGFWHILFVFADDSMRVRHAHFQLCPLITNRLIWWQNIFDQSTKYWWLININ